MPTNPYLVFGVVHQEGTSTPATSNNLTLRNETTNEAISTITNASGQYIFDLANLLSSYTEGDFIKITGTGGSANGQNLRFKCICKREQAQIENLDIKYEIG